MKVFIDLHIHSALSACSENEMTPNNIVNMAFLKGLDVIAVTDHNSVENLKAVISCGQSVGIVVLPGMELETREEVHLICLFSKIDAALKLQKHVYAVLPRLKNREDIFGQQLVLDAEDNIVEVNKRFLLTAADIGIEDVCEIVSGLGGVVIPAHVDRNSYSILSNLGRIPENLNFKYLEISKTCDTKRFLLNNPLLNKFRFLTSSDAHRLGDILEKETYIEVNELTALEVIRALKNQEG